MTDRRQSDIDRLPPHSIETERSLLGALLTDVKLMETWLEKSPGGEVFYDLRHQTLLSGIRDCYEAAGTYDVVSVRQRLHDNGTLEEVGGMAGLMECQEACVTPLQFPQYLAIVLDKWKRRKLLQLAGQCSEWAYAPDNEVTAVLAQAEEAVMSLNREVTTAEERKISEELPAVIDEIEEDYKRGKPMMKGLPTGLRYLDNMLCGLQDGELIVLAARPSCGKTTLAFQIAEHIGIEQNLPVGMFSLEMLPKALVQRTLFSMARVDLQTTRNGFIANRDVPRLMKSSQELIKAKIWITPPRRMTVEQLAAQARRMTRQYGLRLLVIDYYQLLGSEQRGAGRTDELEEVSRSLKQLAMDLGIPVLLLAQMNRDFEKKERNRKPMMSDLKGCGGLEQDADVVGFLYDQVIKNDDDPDNPQLKFLERLQACGVPSEWCQIEDAAWRSNIRRINLLIEKQRNGPTGDVELIFVKPWLRFLEPNKFQERAERRRGNPIEDETL